MPGVQTALGHLGVAKEAVWGTGVAPTKYVPYDTTKIEDEKKSVKDDARRGNITRDYNVIYTVQSSKIDLEFPIYVNELGYFLLGLFGKDAVTGSSPTGATTLSAASAVGATTISTVATFAVNDIIQIDSGASGVSECRTVTAVSGTGPYTLTLSTATDFAHLSGAAVAKVVAPFTSTFTADSAQKSLTLQHYDGVVERQFAGCIVDEVNIKGDAEGIVKVSVKMQSKLGTTVATTTATIDATIKPLVGTMASLVVDAAANTSLFGFDFTFKRESKLIYGASNSQAPTKAVQGRISAEGKVTFDVVDGTEYGKFDGGTHTLALTLNGTASNSAVITFSNLFVEKASKDFGGEAQRVDWDFVGAYSTTDAGPCKLAITNSTASH